MSLTELVAVEGSLAFAFLLSVVALALGVITVTPGRFKIARNCCWAACAIFTGIAIMWGVTTDSPFWVRAIVMGFLAAVAAIAAVEFTRFITKEQTERQPKAKTYSERPLRRLIAYRGFDPIIPLSGTESKFRGYNISVYNVSNDTITARLMFLNVDIDGMIVLSIPEGAPVIIQQTTGNMFKTWRHAEDVPIPLGAKAITVEFEVDYDSIPENGIRKSYRKIAHHLNWANGPNSAPLLEPQTVDEWER